MRPRRGAPFAAVDRPVAGLPASSWATGQLPSCLPDDQMRALHEVGPMPSDLFPLHWRKLT